MDRADEADRSGKEGLEREHVATVECRQTMLMIRSNESLYIKISFTSGVTDVLSRTF